MNVEIANRTLLGWLCSSANPITWIQTWCETVSDANKCMTCSCRSSGSCKYAMQNVSCMVKC